jgi:hypothetical protein
MKHTPYRPGGWILHQTLWSFASGFDSQTRGTRENSAPCVKVPGSSRVLSSPHAHSFVIGPAVINTRRKGACPRGEPEGRGEKSLASRTWLMAEASRRPKGGKGRRNPSGPNRLSWPCSSATFRRKLAKRCDLVFLERQNATVR